jgi:hypothetical protein
MCVCVCLCVCLLWCVGGAPLFHGQVPFVEVVALTRARDACLTHAFSTHCQHVSTLKHNRREELHSRAHPRLSHLRMWCRHKKSQLHSHAHTSHVAMWCCASPQIRTAQKEPAAFTRTHLPSFTHVCGALDVHCIPRKRAALVRASSLISLTPVLLLLRYANISTLMHTVQKSCTRG